MRVSPPPVTLLRQAGMILDRPTDFAWTVQGFGMIRTYLDPDKRWRLNVWTKSLRIPDVSHIHDHPWSFTSWVLCGRISNTRFVDYGDGSQPAAGHALPFQHVTIETGEGGGPVGPVGVRYLTASRPEIYEAGEGYVQDLKEVHTTAAVDGTVTLNERTAPTPEHTANIYWPRGPWVDAEPRPATKAEIHGAVIEAMYQARLAKFRRFS